MAKYSRSALSMKESLREISTQKAEKFLNTFYFQYGHRSHCRPGAHCLRHRAPLHPGRDRGGRRAALGRQERSTRYQDFKKSGYYVPTSPRTMRSATLYRRTVDSLFAEYESLSERMFQHLAEHHAQPAEMKQDAYERTLRARAFDISRYCCRWRPTLRWAKSSTHAHSRTRYRICFRTLTRRCATWVSC